MEKEKNIGVFDSGLGGLTVVKSIIESMPGENIVYFGDTANVPYGTRSEEQIKKFVLEDVRFISGFELKAVVIACNTADCVARADVEKKYDIPVFGIIEPTAERAAAVTKNNRIGVIATPATIANGAYEKAVKKYKPEASVFGVACPMLVPLVEDGRFLKGDAAVESILRDYLAVPGNEKVDTLVLGCTHYPLLSDIISDIMPEVNIVSSSACAVQSLKNNLEISGLVNNCGGRRQYFVSGNAAHFQQHASVFMGNDFTGPVLQAGI